MEMSAIERRQILEEDDFVQLDRIEDGCSVITF